MRILVVEDEQKLNGIIHRGLSEEGYVVDSAYDGKEALSLAKNIPFDVIVLDVMLPKKTGLAVSRELREDRIHTPILMLTAKDTVEDRVAGLDAGADDYLIKPFAFNELLARIRSLLRRRGTVESSVLQVGPLWMDSKTREVTVNDVDLELTNKEFIILEYFMKNPKQVITRMMLEERAWSYESDTSSNVVDVYIRRLRKKIQQAGGGDPIQTIRGAGYRLKVL